MLTVVNQLEVEGIYVLPFHEIESVLCIPTVVTSLAACLMLVEKLPAEVDVIEIILKHWAKDNAV